MVTLRHILLLLLIATRLHGQAYSPRTQIRIIGTVHSGNSQLSYRNLYLVIQQYKPDIILYEQSTRYKNIIGIRTAKALHISKPSIEKLSITKYKKNNKKCIILPYDTAFTRRKYIKNYIKLYNSLYNKLDNAVMTTDDSLLYSKHIKLRNNYYSNINNQNLELLNTIEVYSMSDTLNEQGNRIVLPLAKKYLLDTLLYQYE